MDKINSVNKKSDILKAQAASPATPPKLVLQAKKTQEAEVVGRDVSFDETEITSHYDTNTQNRLKDDYRQALSTYELGKSGICSLSSPMKNYFNVGTEEARQEMVEHLFSTRNELKAYTASLFSGLNKEKDHITPFDEAAREKSLYSARNALKKDPATKTSTMNWLKTVGNLGEDKDIPLLTASHQKINSGIFKDSVGLNTSALGAMDRLISRHPDSVNHTNVGEVSNVVMESMNSDSSSIRNKSVSICSRLSHNKSFTENFSRSLSRFPLTENTALSMGQFTKNLRSNNPESVTFTSLVLDKTMKNSTKDFKKTVLHEASRHFVKYPPGDDPDTARDTTTVLGKHFETLLKKDERESFRTLSSKEKINRITGYFHQKAQ